MRRVACTAHTSPGWQTRAGRKIRRPAKNKAMRAPAMKNGRYGSSSVRFPIHAPLKPRATRTRGPRQQVEAKMAANPPTRSAPEPVRSELLSPVSPLTWHSPVCYCLFLSKLGNERISCAVLCCNYVEPNAALALASEGRQVSAVHRPAFLPTGGAPGHKAPSESLANSRGL